MSNKKNYFVIGLIFVIFLSVSLVSGFSFSDLKFFFTGRVVSNTCNENSFTTVNVWQQGDATLDNIAYAVKDLNSDFVALFKNTGDLYLKGICVSNPNCNPPSSSFVVKNNLGAVVSYIDPNGNLCVESGDCSDKSASCNPTSGGFLIKDLSGNNRAYIDSSGDLCLIGNLNTESKIAKEVLLKILEQTSYNNKILKIESITSNKDIIVSVDSVSSGSIAVGSSELVNGLNIKNIGASCLRCGDGICSSGETNADCPEDCGLPPAIPKCSNGIDDDTDGAVDYPADFSCSSLTDDDEINPKAKCQDGNDNDLDTKIDYPSDPGCTNNQDDDETDLVPAATKCNNGLDDDTDGKIDYPNDPGCTDANDNDETDPTTPPPDGDGTSSTNVKTYSRVRANTLIEYYPQYSKITRVLFKLKEDTRNVRLKVKRATATSSLPVPDGILYQYLEIEFSIGRDMFSLSKVDFEIENEWINRKGLTKSDIKLLKYAGGRWIDLTTIKVDETSARTTYESDTQGFSIFAIVGKKTTTATTIPVSRCGNGIIDYNEDCGSCPSDVRCSSDEYCNVGVCTKRQAVPVNLCGNNAIDAGENCRTCPGDVRCGNDEYCSGGICVQKEIPETKFDIKDYMLVLIIGILIVVGLIIAAIIYLKARRGTSEHRLKNSGDKRIDKLRAIIQEQAAQGYSKEQIRISAIRANWPKDMVEEVLKGIK